MLMMLSLGGGIRTSGINQRDTIGSGMHGLVATQRYKVHISRLNGIYQTNLLLLQQHQIVNYTGSRDTLLIYEALGTI